MANNILLSGDNKNLVDELKKKFVLLREYDKINNCSNKDVKKYLGASTYDILVFCMNQDASQTLKDIDYIKKNYPEIEIILYTDRLEAELMLNAYDKGIYDFITADSENYEITIKLINCMRLKALKSSNTRMEILLKNQGILSAKNDLYQYRYIKEVFDEIAQSPKIRNGIFIILKLEDEIKTKVSSNRLNLLVKKLIRTTDIAATGNGKIYLILENTNIKGAKTVVEKIQDGMGKDFKIHAGLSEIGIQDFESICKNASDSLQSAEKNDELLYCITDKYNSQEEWLSDNEQEIKQPKQYKIFNTAFTNKLKHVIEPNFYRYQKEYESKNPHITINQYSNKVESVFSLKSNEAHSELVIRYDGYTKFVIEIIHKGLDTCENSKDFLPINKLTDKELQKLLKKLKQEFENKHA